MQIIKGIIIFTNILKATPQTLEKLKIPLFIKSVYPTFLSLDKSINVDVTP